MLASEKDSKSSREAQRIRGHVKGGVIVPDTSVLLRIALKEDNYLELVREIRNYPNKILLDTVRREFMAVLAKKTSLLLSSARRRPNQPTEDIIRAAFPRWPRTQLDTAVELLERLRGLPLSEVTTFMVDFQATVVERFLEFCDTNNFVILHRPREESIARFETQVKETLPKSMTAHLHGTDIAILAETIGLSSRRFKHRPVRLLTVDRSLDVAFSYMTEKVGVLAVPIKPRPLLTSQEDDMRTMQQTVMAVHEQLEKQMRMLVGIRSILRVVQIDLSEIKSEISIRKVAFGEFEVMFPIGPSVYYKLHIYGGQADLADIVRLKESISQKVDEAIDKAKEISGTTYRRLSKIKGLIVEGILAQVQRLSRG